MPELPPVEQTWTASTSDYVAALDAAIAAAQAFVNANHDALASLAELQAGINALHGTEIRIGVDASAASAAAAAAATREMEAAAADAAAALAAESAATYEDTLAKDALIRAQLEAAAAERATADAARALARSQAEDVSAVSGVRAAVDEATAAIARYTAWQQGVVAASSEAAAAVTRQAAATQILSYADYQATAAAAEATRANIEQAASESGVAASVEAARNKILGYTATNYTAAAAATKLAIADGAAADMGLRLAAAQAEAAAGLAVSAAAFQTLGQAEAFIAGEQEKLTAAATGLRDALGADSAEAAAFAASLAAGGAPLRQVAVASDSAGNASRRALNGFTAWLGGLNNVRVALFGGVIPGVLSTVTGLHLLADAAIEVTAVVVPAAIALGVFGAAAAPSIQDIVTQMRSLYTVTTATGQSIYPLSGVFAQVADAVRPQVYQLFGEALLVINHNTGTFQTLATGTGAALDQLGARFAVAATTGNGFHIFLANAVTDVAKLGDIVGNLGGVLGNVFRSVPGYAQVLLNLADAGTRVAEWASSAAVPVMKMGLALHGAWLYAGLGVTALSRMIPAALTGLSGFAEKAAYAASGMKILGPAGEAAGAGFMGMAAGAETAAGLPWGWITIAAAGIGVLVYALVTAKSATQQWVASLEQSVGAAAAVNGLITLLGAQAQVATRLSIAQRELAHTSATLTTVNLHTGVAMRTVNPAYTQAQRNVAALQAGQQQLADQTNLYNYRVGVLARALGSSSAAMGMLAASGVKMSEFLKYGKDALAQVEAQVMATAAAYRAMGQTGGMLGADMNVMNVLASDQYNAVTKLNQAWGTWIQTVTGGMASLSQFETALGGMASDSAATSASLSGSFSSIKQNVGGMTYTLKGFGPAAMQSWQQFTSAVNQGNTVIDQMRTYMALGAVSNRQYTSTVQALVGQMAPFTQGNRAAVTMLDNLAIQAGGPTTTSLRTLEQWAGVSGRAARNQLAKGMEAATVAGGQLSTVAKNLANTLNADLTGMMSQAQIKASGLRGALNSLAAALQHGGSMANSYHGALIPVISSMLRLHQSVPTITTELQAMGVQITQAEVAAIIAAGHLNSMTGSVRNVTQAVLNSIGAMQQYQNWLNSLHGKTIYVNTVFTSTYVGQTNAAGQTTYHHRPGGAHGGLVSATGAIHAAAGAVIPGFAPGRDIVPAWLSPGEAILNPYATRMLGPGFIHMLNTMAERGGGVNPAALQTHGTGGGGFGFGGGMPVIENHLYLDGQEIFANQKVHTLRYNTRNSGARTGAVVPGTTPQV